MEEMKLRLRIASREVTRMQDNPAPTTTPGVLLPAKAYQFFPFNVGFPIFTFQATHHVLMIMMISHATREYRRHCCSQRKHIEGQLCGRTLCTNVPDTLQHRSPLNLRPQAFPCGAPVEVQDLCLSWWKVGPDSRPWTLPAVKEAGRAATRTYKRRYIQWRLADWNMKMAMLLWYVYAASSAFTKFGVEEII